MSSDVSGGSYKYSTLYLQKACTIYTETNLSERIGWSSVQRNDWCKSQGLIHIIFRASFITFFWQFSTQPAHGGILSHFSIASLPQQFSFPAQLPRTQLLSWIHKSTIKQLHVICGISCSISRHENYDGFSCIEQSLGQKSLLHMWHTQISYPQGMNRSVTARPCIW